MHIYYVKNIQKYIKKNVLYLIENNPNHGHNIISQTINLDSRKKT